MSAAVAPDLLGFHYGPMFAAGLSFAILVPVLRSRPARTHRVSAPTEHDKSRPGRAR
jgi:hypothetical protein